MATSTTATTTTTTAAVASSPVPPEEEEDEDGKESVTASTSTFSPPPSTYAQNLTCCVCMDELQVDTFTFLRNSCCGKGMHYLCQVEASTDRCDECRAERPGTAEEMVKQVRVWVDKGKAWAQTTLATQYRYGKGVELSYEKAIECYTLALQQGNPHAMFG